MRHTTGGRRAVIVVAAMALLAGASAAGPARASSAAWHDAAATTSTSSPTLDLAADPTPGSEVTSVSNLVAAAAARVRAGVTTKLPATDAPNPIETLDPDSPAPHVLPGAPSSPSASAPAQSSTEGDTPSNTPSDAQSGGDPASTPVTIPTPDGRLMSYVVNATTQTPAETQFVAAAVRASGGVVVQAWPEIGVVIAHSTRSAFSADVVTNGGSSVASVGATRSVAVTEGTPGQTASADGPVPSGDEAGSSSAADSPRSELIPPRATPATPTALPTPTAPATPATPARPATPTAPSKTLPPAGPPTQPARSAPATDPLEADQWDLSVIKADRAHEITDGSRRVVVGVLDSGIDADHPDLVDNLDVADSVNCTDAGRPDRSVTGWQPTTSDHGTHVAGTIAAERNGLGIVGVAPKARVASVRVVNDEGFVYPEYAVCGFVWAGLRGMDVTNNSYYIDPFQFYCSDQPDQAAAKEAVRRAVAWSTSRGVVHVAAAGNSAYDLADKTTDATSPDDGSPVVRTINSGCEDIPTELPGVVTVSSLAQVGNTLDSSHSSFSNRGLGKVDVAAPGSGILSTIVSDNGYGLKSGTSMASPHVAGVLALMKSRHPTWKPDQLISRLIAQADPKACPLLTPVAPCVGTPADNSYFGHGVVDALEAVR